MQILPDPQAPQEKARLFGSADTSLARRLTETQAEWLLDFATEQWNTYYDSLGPWRMKLEKFERMADDDYSDRRNSTDPDRTDALRSIFERENHSLGLVSGASQTVYARAKDDIFGVRPWLAATPQGTDDIELADKITKHSQWKFDQSNLEDTYIDALHQAITLGTTFVKEAWRVDEETFETVEKVAVSKATGEPLMGETGDHIRKGDPVPPGHETDIEWKEISVEHSSETYNNIDACCLDFKDVAFDSTASELRLDRTSFFHKFRMGVLDIARAYGLDDDQKQELMDLVATTEEGEEARSHRGESSIGSSTATMMEQAANVQIQLVEGFIRCDPTDSNNPVSIRIIFAPGIHALFRVDYLQTVTPRGMLPVFPVRCFKVPRRIIGKGYWEKYEDAHNSVDSLYNITTVRNRYSADNYVGVRPDKLKDGIEGEHLDNYPGKTHELAEGVENIGEAISVVNIPDRNDRSDKLLEQMLQMVQTAMGTFTASQGDLTGVPTNETLGGAEIIKNSADALVGCQIVQMMTDLERALNYAVHLHYANQDRDETFVWGDGRDATLLEIKAGDVAGLQANVSLTLTQQQNLHKLEGARSAMAILATYIQMAPPYQSAFRRIVGQALRSLGFNDADEMLDNAAEQIMAMQQQAMEMEAQQAAETGAAPPLTE